MRIDGITELKNTDGKFAVENFFSFCDTAVGIFAEKDRLVAAPHVKTLCRLPDGLRAVKAFSVDGQLIVYCSDGKLYYKEKDKENDENECVFRPFPVPAFKNVPKVFGMIYDGEKTVVAVDKDGAYAVNSTVNRISLVKGDDYLFCSGTLFVASKSKIYVYYSDDVSGVNLDLMKAVIVSVPKSKGNAARLIEHDGSIIAVCQRGFARIEKSADDMGFTFKEITVKPLRPLSETAVSMGDKIIFKEADKLYALKNGLTEIEGLLDRNSYTVCGNAVKKDEYYLMPVLNGAGEKFIYCYDALNGKDCFISALNMLLSEDGYVISVSDGAAGVISFDKEQSEKVYKSVVTDFNVSGEKTLYGVLADINCEAEMIINGDGVKRSFLLKKGKNRCEVFIKAEEFSCEITSFSEDFEITKLIFYYR